MSEFRFKQFSVKQDRAALKVGTDAVLLGALMTVSRHSGEASRMLDIGTGTGVIALMAAQRCAGIDGVRITGIDIDAPSIEDARENFAASSWSGCLQALHCSLEEFAGSDSGCFGHIFSNPPYYDNSLTNPDMRETAARHTESLSYREIIAFAAERLVRPAPACPGTAGGTLSLILPAEEEQRLLRTAASFDLFPFRIVRIRTTARKKPRRIIAEFRLRAAGAKPQPSIEELCLDDACTDSAVNPLAVLDEDFYVRTRRL